MDKNSIIGFVLIAIVFVVWMIMSTNQNKRPQETAQTTGQQQDTASVPIAPPQEQAVPAVTANSDSVTGDTERQYGKWFSSHVTGEEEIFTVETEKYIAQFSTRGGGLKRWKLKDFFTWNNKPLQLIDWKLLSECNILFGTSDGKLVDTKDFYFRFENIPGDGKIVLSDTASYEFRAVLDVVGDSSRIVKHYIVRSGGFGLDLDIEMRNMEGIIANYEYQVVIHSPALTEQNSVDEASFAEAHAQVDGERMELDASDSDEQYRQNINGKTEWIATHNKYFLSAVIPKEGYEGSGAYLEGTQIGLPDEGIRKLYQASLKIKFLGVPYEKTKLLLFIGPMEYDLLKSQHEGLEQVLTLGWAWVVRPFSEYLIIPLFNFLHSFIPNYGIVIILFTLIIKLLLYPLTKKSMESMRRMQALQPMMTEIREKNKEDQQKQNTEMMRLYKEYGVNPAGGCLPMLLQMPILFALFTIFRSTIDLRQEPFAFWIQNLAAPDIIVRLPFKLPLLGMTFISGLALAMAVTMFIQQKQSVRDPRQKAMVYMMPVMFWLMFNGFPSGLNLYYFMFNLLSILQQYFINKKHSGEPLKKVQKKGKKDGWMERTMKSVEKRTKDHQKTRRK